MLHCHVIWVLAASVQSLKKSEIPSMRFASLWGKSFGAAISTTSCHAQPGQLKKITLLRCDSVPHKTNTAEGLISMVQICSEVAYIPMAVVVAAAVAAMLVVAVIVVVAVGGSRYGGNCHGGSCGDSGCRGGDYTVGGHGGGSHHVDGWQDHGYHVHGFEASSLGSSGSSQFVIHHVTLCCWNVIDWCRGHVSCRLMHIIEIAIFCAVIVLQTEMNSRVLWLSCLRNEGWGGSENTGRGILC